MNDDKKKQLIEWLESMPWWDELPYAKMEEKHDALRKGLSEDAIVAFVNRNGGMEVHRSWRDTMLSQGRKVKPELMVWESLPIYDQVLDRKISLDALLDFATWVQGHPHLVSRNTQEPTCTPDEPLK